MVETYMQTEAQKHKAVYFNLSNVIEFERILKDCMAAVWKTSDAQCSFWTHLQQPNIVDFNLLDKDNENIYKYAKETAHLWEELCAINPNYQTAIANYTAYLKEMRNNDQGANDIQDKVKNDACKKSLSILVKHNDVLFDEKSAVLHISGTKEALGKILKVNQGIQAVFGYNAIELLQNSISKVMPSIVGRRHNELMELHFKTGRSRIFNKERYLFGLHKDGYCFHMKLLVKPMHKLEDGFIQYVGMIVQTQEEDEYIITDTHGIIDCMSKNLAAKLCLNTKTINKAAGINIQILAPELMYCYQDEMKKSGKGQKFKEPGGEELVLMVPNNFKKIMGERSKRPEKHKSGKVGTESVDRIVKYNNAFNKKRPGKKGLDMTPTQMLQLEEYKNFIVKTKVKCEIQDMRFGLGKSTALAFIRR